MLNKASRRIRPEEVHVEAGVSVNFQFLKVKFSIYLNMCVYVICLFWFVFFGVIGSLYSFL